MRTRSCISEDPTYEDVPFRFLDLPAELRTAILALAARHSGTALLKRNSRGVVSSVDSISLANKQIRGEYLGVLYGRAQNTLAYVLDFNFRHVVTYFNKLNKAEAEALPMPPAKTIVTTRHPTKYRPSRFGPSAPFHTAVRRGAQHPHPIVIRSRTITLLLDFTAKCDWQTTYLLRWLDRLKAPNKTGVSTHVSYASPRWDRTLKWPNSVVWEEQVELAVVTPRQKEEVARIFAAARNDISV